MANWITLSRIFFGPLFAFFFMQGVSDSSMSSFIVALIMLILIEISDGIDGFVARKFNQVTDMGKYLDPLADSMSRLTIFLSFLLTGMIPWWMFLIFLYRDVTVSGVRIFAIKEGTVVSARISGKLKAIFQAIGSFAVLFWAMWELHSGGSAQPVCEFSIPFYMMLFPALFTAWSGYDYVNGNWEALKKNMTVKS